MKGFELHKSGARVNELLERQFVVPTLDVAPTETTSSWIDGKYVVAFRIGEMCRVNENGEWVFYRLQDISDGKCLWGKANSADMPDMSDYYTRDEVDDKITEAVTSIEIPEDESIKNVTEDEYNSLFETDSLSDKTMYFVSKDGSPIALYIGKVQIAVREEGSKGFAYNFPIIF
jgi:hypothetical protein